MSELPWFKFFPNDFLNDRNLMRCSNEAIGIYIKFICLAFESEERGVMITSGIPWTKEEILDEMRGNYESNEKSFNELLKFTRIKVRETDGAFYNSRMVDDEEKRNADNEKASKWRKNQKNESLQTSDSQVTNKVTEQLPENYQEITAKLPVEDRSQKSEVRRQNTEERIKESEEEEKKDQSEKIKIKNLPSSTVFENSLKETKPDQPKKQNLKDPPKVAPPPPIEKSQLAAGWIWVKDWFESVLKDEPYLADIARHSGFKNQVRNQSELELTLRPWIVRFLKDQQALEGKQNFLVKNTDKRKHLKSWLSLMDISRNPTIDLELRKSKLDKNGKDPYDTSWAYAKLGITKPGAANQNDVATEVEGTWEPVQSQSGT